ncbi:zinc finger protein ZFAT-like isoform X1 [Haliotis rufescens]|uniref:zinc finger protein ZFAT-like isoform X1 n=1 Tax=Haliotis rufescens TaxID=6454 RepID=UPI00201F3FD2|nr:zinc finger protein ZFAT-like isoform X1 [Haliotis rufescens]XP_048253745.1 zinc finger protein ZFAT-like isoform X1 [Haliotis rufescens]
MPMDTFICGTCQGAFNEIELFMRHKGEGCEPQQPEVIQVHVNGSGEITEYTDAAGDGTTTLNLFSDTIDQGISVETGDHIDENGTPTLIILDEGQSLVTQAVTDKATCTPSTEAPGVVTSQYAADCTCRQPVTQTDVKAKRKGRPKKGEEKNKVIDAVSKEVGKPPLPEKSKDGKFHCVRCKRAFTKERFFNTHKCLASSDYVIITSKDVKLDSGDDSDELEDVGAEEVEDAEEYTAPADLIIADEHRAKKFDNVLVSADPDGDAYNYNSEKPTDEIDDIPVFRTLEEKVAFETNLNVDLSSVDQMFKIHMIEQDLNENASSVRNMSTSLSLYSCNICDKVFKTLSHMRLHCLIHTELKPFKCFKCSYASNSKGNLYTHMRKHTGQFYNCSKCSFRTVNKSHLLEHEATHSNVRKQCQMCKKDYNTLKSLINHVRKYHKFSAKGREYLQTFLQGRQSRGATVIHQCHVCNRKFKKKIDRDRHLFIHDIKDIPNIQHCQLCDYTASRRTYLEKHYLKHRVIYCCTLCDEKFLSTVRLIDHLTSVHLKDDPNQWENLFEQSINNSLYLPEPDESFDATEKEFINLPEELSSTSLKKTCVETLESESEQKEGDKTSNPETVLNTDGSLICTNQLDKDAIMDASNKECVGLVLDPVKDSVKGASDQIDTAADEDSEPMDTDLPMPGLGEDVEMEGQKKEADKETDGAASQETGSKANSESLTDGLTEDNELDKNKLSDNPKEVKETVEEATKPLEEEDEAMDVQEESEPINEEEETMNEQDASEISEPQDDKDKTIVSIVKRLGYREMSMEIFHKMRETFGCEECEYCGRLFYNKADYEPHLRTHTGDKPFNCEHCNYRAISKDSLKRHIEKEHLKMTFPCKECDYAAPSRTQLWNHQLKHLGVTGVECNVCQQKFDTIKKLRNHMILDHPETDRNYLDALSGVRHRMQGKMGRRSYKCPYCDRVFIRANSELQKHIWVHEGIKPYKCPICPHACRSKTNLQAHMLRHSSEKPFQCGDCGKAYKSKTALRWHVRSHKEGKFKCDKCPYEATQSSHLKRHMETHDIVKKFVCQHCNYSANTPGYMKIHYTRNHKGMTFIEKPTAESDKPPPGEARVYKCLSCDYLFGNMSDLKRHLRVRHHVQVQDISCMDQMHVSEVQVLQCGEEAFATEQEAGTEVTSTITTVQDNIHIQPAVTGQSELDEKTASAVNLLQQIIDMSQQGAFGQQQQITVQAEDGQMVAVNPETIIVQQDGEEVLLTDANAGVEGGQYVIQYVSPDMHLDNIPLEIQTLEEQTS